MENALETRNTPKIAIPKRVLRTTGNVKTGEEASSFAMTNVDSETNAEVILDYGRCEGGFPVFIITSASAPDRQQRVAFQVTYSETIEGVDNENGDGPFFLFSNAMDSYRVCQHHAAISNDTQAIKPRFVQASQRYQKITLLEQNTCIIFSKVGFQAMRPEATVKANFHCSDETINRIWRDGVRTVDMCTVAREETVPAWDVTDEGTRVYGSHWAPCRQGTRWTDYRVTFQTKIEKHGASWAVRMVTNGLIFCLDVRSRTLTAVEGLSNKSSILPSIERGSWQLPDSLDLSTWLRVETLAVKDRITVTIDSHEVAALTGLHVKAMLGDRLVNTGSVAFGGPPGWIALYRDLSVIDPRGGFLYKNALSRPNAEQTYDDFQVGTNKLACIIDGAKRDRVSFGGDAFVTGRSIAYSTGDFEAWKGTIELLLSHQTKEGYLGNLCPIQAPGHEGHDDPPVYGHYSLTCALLLVVSIKDYWMHSGDRAFVENSYGQLERQMEFTREFLKSDGLIEAPLYLSMTWFPMGGPVFGVSTGLNLAYLDALNAMALMSEDDEIALKYSCEAMRLKDSLIRMLWNNEQGTMRPALYLAANGVFQDVNAYAATLGVSPDHPELVEGIFPSSQSLPSAFRGLERWDMFGLASPYASGFALEALFAKNEGPKARELLSRVWGVMADRDNPNYSGAHWEAMKMDGTPFNHDVSLTHGWSSWPVFLLPRYLAGVYPLEAGWKRIGVEPVLAGLEKVECSLEIPQGLLSTSVCVSEKGASGVIKLLVPVGSTAVVKAPKGWGLDGDGVLQGSGIDAEIFVMSAEDTATEARREPENPNMGQRGGCPHRPSETRLDSAFSLEIMDIQATLKTLSLEEKVRLLSGTPDDFVSIAGIPDKGIPPLKTADSISGIRPSEFNSTLTTACFPNTACIASTWNTELLEKMGRELTRQAKMKHAQMILGPTINIQRDPRAGRNFECFSEDPLLSGYMAAAIVNGIQSQGYGACAKHFVCNDSETQRRYYNVDESPDGRTLREIYLAAWSFLLKKSNPAGIMTAYNKVNGAFCCDSETLIGDILRKEWDYKGIVMSDWFGTRSTVAAIKAGVDVEMPVPVFRGDRLIQAVKGGEISEDLIDDSVSRLLNLRNRTRAAQSEGEEKSVIIDETNNIALQLAQEGIVLLKNENETLPLSGSTGLKVGVIGEYAKRAVFTGGGSASCNPQYREVPLDLLQKVLPEGHKVSYATGVRMRRIIPTIPTEIVTTDQGKKGVEVSYYNADQDEPVLVETLEEAAINLMAQGKPGLKIPGSQVKMSTNLIPKTTGTHTLALRHSGSFTVELDDVCVLKGDAPNITTEQFLFNLIKLESRVQLQMEAGRSYSIYVKMQSREPVIGEPTPYGLTLAFEEEYSEEKAISEAVEVAKNSDITIIYAGRSEQYESEGFDLEEITLPANQVAMIKAVAAASKKTAVLLHCGNPIDISSFVDDVDAIVNMHFPGQEGPQAMVDILAGKVNPSGRLTATWFKTLQDWPSYSNFPAQKNDHGEYVIKYADGLEIGYRAQVSDARVQFPFGHGLSYTSFAYNNLKVSLDEPYALKVSVRVTNNGRVAGKEVVQVYICPPQTGADWRPSRELKGFSKVNLSPSEAREVSIDIEVNTFNSHWSEASRVWSVDKGTYAVQIGDQRATFVI
ncbi:alpha-L-rhamnosidase A [Fusarium beomiforme]|uniref:beta-glucosidase n=1 Tax=Fusarium beomiforme TaxID=44412 RepID=A0A9P5AU19_9HYPO|nr:alpha-L-rhamnosidase A [Fusarium beomiforme]